VGSALPWQFGQILNGPLSYSLTPFKASTPEYRLRTFQPPRQQIALSEGTLQKYVGKYDFTPAISIQITREGTRLLGQVTGQPRFELYAEQESKFFAKVVDAQFTFVMDDSGLVTALVLHQNGASQTARRAP
jgi:hypothetical protein